MYLLDTNVLSEFTRSNPDPGVVEWIRRQSHEQFFMSAISWGEIRFGLSLLPDGKKRSALLQWFESELLEKFSGRILVVDRFVADLWGIALAHAKRDGRTTTVAGAGDLMIAATAAFHNLTVVTRNTRDFESLGVRVFNPWAA